MTKAALLRELFAARVRDLDRFFALTAPDFTMDWSRSRGPHAGIYTGREEIEPFLRLIDEIAEDPQWEPLEIIEAGEDTAVVVVRMSGRGRGSGIEMSGTGTHVWHLRDGRA